MENSNRLIFSKFSHFLILFSNVLVVLIFFAVIGKTTSASTTLVIPINEGVTVRSGMPDRNYDGEEKLETGRIGDYYSVTLLRASLQSIPNEAVIESATLYIYVYQNNNITDLKINQLASDTWHENSVTYNNMPYGDANLLSSRINSLQSNTWNWADVTQIVKDWHSGNTVNNGFQIRPPNFRVDEYAIFYGDDLSLEIRPKIEVTYQIPSQPPDLIVQTPSVNDSTLTPGQSFTISATVKNQGPGTSSSTTLRYYRSTNSTISGSNTPIGTDSVSYLSAGSTSPESISVSAPTTPGTYWVGACVDGVSGELSTSNNCSSGKQITVPQTADVQVNSVSLSLPTGDPRGKHPASLSYNIKNNGPEDLSSSSYRIDVYLSTNSTISASDTKIGDNGISLTRASGSSATYTATSTGRSYLTIPSNMPAGTYYVGLRLIPLGSSPSDPNDSNNWKSGNIVTIPEQPPDLIVQTPSVSDSTLTPGQSFTISATVKNQGTGTSSSTTLRYYRSTNSTISGSNTPIGTDSVSYLSAGSTSPESISVSAPTTPGTYWVGACVNSVSGESSTNNNCSTGVQITVSAPPTVPDLVVQSPGVNDSTLTTGQSFTISATVKNQGNGTSNNTTLRYFRSTDSTISESDSALGTDSVSSLPAGSTSPENISVYAPNTSGTYWVGACVDSVSGDSSTNNNCSTGVQITVSAPQTVPDLVVQPPGVNDSTLTTGQSFTISATVKNQGNGTSNNTTLRYFRSTDSTISESDSALGTDSVSSLPAGSTSPESISASAPNTVGTYWVGACVDAVSGESSTNNNCSAGVQITVSQLAMPPEIKEVIPHDNAGILDNFRVPSRDFSFAARIVDSDGINITDPTSIIFTVYKESSFPLGSKYDLGDIPFVRVVKLLPSEPDTAVTKLWVIFIQSFFDYDEELVIQVEAKDNLDVLMSPKSYFFTIESQTDYLVAQINLPSTESVNQSDSALGGPYDTGIKVTSGGLNGAKIVSNSNDPIQPYFGPSDEIPQLVATEMDAVGSPLNLQPPTVFSTPVKVFIPVPGRLSVNDLSVYLYNGTEWILASDAAGNVQPGGEGWMVPGTRINHNFGNPSSIELKLYHFTGVQAAVNRAPPPDPDPDPDPDRDPDHDPDPPSKKPEKKCFISTILKN